MHNTINKQIDIIDDKVVEDKYDNLFNMLDS